MRPHRTPARLTAGALKRGVCVLACASLTAVASQQARAQQPRFRSSVEVTSLDVTVLDDRGQPVSGLQPSDFAVRIDGDARRVISAEWVPLKAPEGPRLPGPPEGYSSNEALSGGRLIVIAVDQPNIRFGAATAISTAVSSFLDQLEPSDRVAAIAFGQGGFATSFTPDRARIKQAIARMNGRERSMSIIGASTVSLAEAFDISDGQSFTLNRVITRECAGQDGMNLMRCGEQIDTDARALVVDARSAAQESVAGLRALFSGLRTVESPKTVVLVSEGFVMREQPEINELGAMAAAARTSLFVLRLDNIGSDITESRAPVSPFNDRAIRGEGLETLASAARGSLYTVTGSATTAFERIQAELSGYYLLGVESEPEDKDGRSHSVRIDVSRKGVTVRSRRQIMTARDDQAGKTPREAMLAALNAPLLASALPLRVATYSLQGPEQSKIQLLIHADVGTDYSTAKSVAMAYLITDEKTGRIVESQVLDARLPPVMNGVPSPLQFAGGASLPPGDYTLKLSVAEGDRVGTVEHPIHASLVDGAQARLSELMVGGPATADLLRPTVGYRVSFGSVQGYVEAYGRDTNQLKVQYEIAPGPTEPPLLTAEVNPRPAGGERTIYSQALPVRQLPPGKYYLRAVVTAGSTPVKTLSQPFEVAPPAVLMTSATATIPSATAPGDLYLPIADEVLGRPFKREIATHSETLRSFRGAVDADGRAAFDKGAGLLAKGDYVQAEESFKSAMGTTSENAAVLAYLAATFAASGHDIEAANAWQTALVDGSDFPEIYEWLSGALLRTHQMSEARAVLDEATSKWPADQRFSLPRALIFATFGQGREAVRELERYLASHADDYEAQSLGVEWFYHLRNAGTAARSPEEDLKVAKKWADAYAKSKGPQAALVRQWIQFLESGSETR